MGFTKTSEGRVFFKNADNDDVPVKTQPKKSNGSSAGSASILPPDNTQMQILLLLKSLNTKLQSSKMDQSALKKQLAQYRATIKRLEEKTAEQESNYIDLEQKISIKQSEAIKKTARVENNVKKTLKQLEEAKELVKELEEKNSQRDETIEEIKSELEEQRKKDEEIIKRQKALTTMQKQQGEKMVDNVAAYVALTKRVSEAEANNAALDNKIEEATSLYMKLDRKIDKAIEDRHRILRKVDKIEQAVLETRDALNAKAMVLLTDKGVVAGVNMPQISDDTMQTDPVLLSRRLQEEALMPWWRRPIRIQATSLVLMMIIVLLMGWIISSMTSTSPIIESKNRAMQPPKIALHDIEPAANDIDASDITATNDAVTDNNEYIDDFLFNDADAVDYAKDISIYDIDKETTRSEIINNLDINNEDEMLAAFEKDPDIVAARLNQIEPNSLTAEDLVEPAKNETTKNSNNNKITSNKINNLVNINENNELYIASLKKRIKPDPNLTDIAKKIESKAFQGIAEAQHDMGAIYVAGHGQIKKDLNRAVFWFKEAAKNGIANAKYNLGVLYHQGLGVKQDINKALQLYKEAADQGHPEAGYNLAIANIEGIGVPYNPEKAAKFFKMAANKGVVEAAYNLGLIYENGLLGENSPNEALAWYKIAADQGSKEANLALEQLARSLGITMEEVDMIIESLPSNNINENYIVSQIQEELMKLGLYNGEIDGLNGPMTENAIKQFQKSANLEVNGKASQELLNYLRNNHYYR